MKQTVITKTAFETAVVPIEREGATFIEEKVAHQMAEEEEIA